MELHYDLHLRYHVSPNSLDEEDQKLSIHRDAAVSLLPMNLQGKGYYRDDDREIMDFILSGVFKLFIYA